MAINTSMKDENLIVTGQKAINNAAATKAAKTIGKQTTDRGTLITKSNNEMGKNSFLKILVAEMSNQDPTQNQDSSVMVTQMAQLTSMEQMSNLNDTMSTNAYQNLVGKGVTLDVNDNDGNPYTGIVKGVSKENGTFYLSVEVDDNGEVAYKKIDASKLKAVLDIPDTKTANMALNSNFIAASNLAKDENNRVVLLEQDSTGKNVLVKGTVKSAFFDKGEVKIRLSTLNSDGTFSADTKDYSYSDVVKAGKLSSDDMDVKVEDYVSSTTDTSDSNDPTKDPNSSSYDKKTAMSNLVNSKTEVKGSSSSNSFTTDTIGRYLEKLKALSNV